MNNTCDGSSPGHYYCGTFIDYEGLWHEVEACHNWLLPIRMIQTE